MKRGFDMERLILIAGPTASGKSELALNLAETLNTEIISADSMQIYKGMDIGTAKLPLAERRGIPHHLIDICMPDEEYSVKLFQEQASSIICSLNEEGKIPIVVGGTSLFLHSLVYKLDFDLGFRSEKIRSRYEATAEEKGHLYLHDRLKELDPISAQRLHPNDTKRIIRALEVYETSGRPMSSFRRSFYEKNDRYDCLYYCLNDVREKLYRRINERVVQMVRAGLIKEVDELMKRGYSPELQSMQAIGYRETAEFLRGEGAASQEELIERIAQNTRRYAKRQLTWFRRSKEIRWLEKSSFDKSQNWDQSVSKHILTEIEHHWS